MEMNIEKHTGKIVKKSSTRTRKPTKQQKINNVLLGAIKMLKSARYDALKRDVHEEPLTIPYQYTETEQIFRDNGRIRSYIEAEELFDNAPVGATVETFCRLAIGKRGGSPQFLGERLESHQAYWDAWKRDCGWQSGECWQDILNQILLAVKVQGDCLVFCDRALTGGKVRIFAADQICSVNDADFERYAFEHGWYEELDSGREYWRQCEGVVLDLEGRVKGYFVTSLRNRPKVDISHATFIPANLARLVFHHNKLTQYRGESALLPNRNLTQNTKSLIASEVQAARNAAETSIIIEEAEGIGTQDVEKLLNGIDLNQATEGTGVSSEDVVAAVGNRDDHTFDALDGKSSIAYVPHGTVPHTIDNANRPSIQIQNWMAELDEQNGNRLGVKSVLSRANTKGVSYSSGELELNLSWQSIECAQMLLERQVVDYVLGVILPDAEYTVYWPESFAIDPEKAEKVKDAKLKGGRATYREILGPYWRDKFAQLAEEMQVARELGILENLSITQTVSGGIIEKKEEELEDGSSTD